MTKALNSTVHETTGQNILKAVGWENTDSVQSKVLSAKMCHEW